MATTNPLREGLRLERSAGPCAVVIFGASGDLTKRKLVPALYRLSQERLLPAEFAVVGVARSPKDDETFRAEHDLAEAGVERGWARELRQRDVGRPVKL